jgi:predicted amidohydrolase
MQDLTLTVIQTELIWEDIEANLKQMDEKINSLDKPTDLIVLPEMFTTGFSMNTVEFAQDMDGSAVKWLTDTAARSHSDIVGSIMIKDRGGYYNRLCWASPDGMLKTYDKRHLFRMAGEEKVYTPGAGAIVVKLKGWRIRPYICYDLRFPVWGRNVNNTYDLAIYVANWPARRASHWKTLLQARSIENQAYVVGVNRVGTDGNGRYYSGDTSIFDPIGQVLFQSAHVQIIQTLTLNAKMLKQCRSDFPVWMDADQFDLKPL